MSEIAQKRTKRVLIVVAGILAVAGLSQFLLEFFDTDTLPSALLFLLAASASFGALTLHFWSRPRARPIVLATAVVCLSSICVLWLTGISVGVATKLWYNQRQWHAQQITSYRYTLRRSCYCPIEAIGPVRVEVHDDALVSITYVDSGAAADPHFFAEVATIDRLFQLIEASNVEGADQLFVTYDTSFRYPAAISIDHDDQAYDDETSYQVTDFEVVRSR